MTGAATVDVSVLGRLDLRVGDRTPPLRNAKARALIVMLALSERRSATRDAVAAVLWAGAAPERRRASLRQSLRAAQEALAAAGGPAIEADRETLGLDPALVGADVDAILRCARRGVAHAALLGGSDPFATLGGEAAAPDDAFAGWLSERGDALRAETVRALEAALERAADPLAARDLARALLALDPADERAAQRLMAAHAALGEPLRALDVYDALWRALDARFGAEPAPETQAQAMAVKRGASGAPAKAAAPRDRDAPLCAIAPFSAAPSSAGGARDREAAEAARLAVAAAAARFGDWRVALSGPDSEGADYRLRGALSPGAGGPSLTLMLERGGVVVGATEAALAADFRRAAADATAALLCALLRDRAETSAAAPTPDSALPPKARAARMRALAHRFAPHALARLAELARESPVDPARTAAAEAGAAGLAAALGGRPPTAAEARRALDAAEAAVDADPLSAEARLAHGWALLFARRHDAAAEACALAGHLNPADPAILRQGALCLALAGRGPEALLLAAEADGLDPPEADPARSLAGMIRFAAGDAEGSLALGEPGGPALARAWRAAALARAGETAAAADLAASLLREGAGDPRALARALPAAAPDWSDALEAALRAAFEAIPR